MPHMCHRGYFDDASNSTESSTSVISELPLLHSCNAHVLVASESVQFARMFLAVIHALTCLMKGKVSLTLAAECKCRDNALNRSYHFSI